MKEVKEKVITFFSQFQQKEFRKGEHVIDAGKDLPGVFCLTEGIIRMYAYSQEGNELTINVYRPVSFFPMGWVINNQRDKYNYETLTNAKVFIAPKEKMLEFISNNPDVVLDLLSRIYNGLNGYFLRMESLLSGNAYLQTVIQILIFTRRFGVVKGDGHETPLTHMQIASLAGLSRETVTREIKKLERKGIITYKGKKLVVLDTTRLEQELCL